MPVDTRISGYFSHSLITPINNKRITIATIPALHRQLQSQSPHRHRLFAFAPHHACHYNNLTLIGKHHGERKLPC
jgi:hypothetical protein